MKLINSTLIKLTLCLIFGIILEYFFFIDYSSILYISSFLVILFGIAYFISRNKRIQHIWFGVIIYFTTISVGILTATLHQQSNFKNHYSKNIVKKNDTTNTINFKIRETLKPTSYQNKYIIDILRIDDRVTSGKALLNISIDSTVLKLNIDDIFITTSNFKAINSSLNPHQFDYKNYLEKQYIYHQLSLNNNELLLVNSKVHTLFGFASRLRSTINSKLKHHNFKANELAIINALLLGQRQDISKEIYSTYADAGVIHILAVSGLHIGILLFLFNFLLKPLEHFKYGKNIKALFIVILLWSFAIIAGLSASVVRAVTMFSIIAIAMNLKRPTNIYNTLAFSIFVLLLIKPEFLFDVGFQLSYLAVFSIVILQPMLYNLVHIKYKFFDFFWKIFTVTVAAQIGVIPISLYYFHQFPSLFFLSNLIIVPCLGFLLGLGIFVIILSLLNGLPDFLASFYGSLISLMNDFVSWISLQEAFLFKNISFSLSNVILSYLLISTLIYTFKKKNYRSIVSVLSVILIIQISILIDKQKGIGSRFIVFHKSKFSMIGIQKGNSLLVHHNLNDSILIKDNILTSYKVGEHIKNMMFDSIQSVYILNKKKLLIIDSLGVYNITGFKPDIVLLRNSPKVNLNRLVDSLTPNLIISDGSNFKTYEQRWKRTAHKKKRLFHQTNEKGAYIFKSY